jgi:organic radical activating enzyme
MNNHDHIPANGGSEGIAPVMDVRQVQHTGAEVADAPLPVMEHFHTLQGEGAHQGRSAYFIRLGGCDVGCVWCDVKDSWDRHRHPLRSVSELTGFVKSTSAPIAVVTGGEPLMHDLGPLTLALRDKGVRTHLETSGAHPMSGVWDWICLSPKKFKAPLPELMPMADELKVVVYHPSDIEWAERHAAMARPGCRLFLQPEWDRLERVMPAILDHILANPQWSLSLQSHKYIRIP